MKEIPLTQGKFALVDDEDYEWLMQWSWCISSAGYAKRGCRIEGKRITVSMHCAIMRAPDGMEVDHADRNPLNNQKSNLRIATRAQNGMNRPKVKRNGAATSQYKGVWYDKRRNCWYAMITINRKAIYLGTFQDEIDAAKAYDNAATNHYGTFAYLNLPDQAMSAAYGELMASGKVDEARALKAQAMQVRERAG